MTQHITTHKGRSLARDVLASHIQYTLDSSFVNLGSLGIFILGSFNEVNIFGRFHVAGDVLGWFMIRSVLLVNAETSGSVRR